MSKNLVVIYSGDDWSKDVPETGSITTSAALAEWCNFGLEQKICVYRAEIDWYDVSRRGFVKAWTNVGGHWKRISRLISPDLVFDKTAGSQGNLLLDLKVDISRQCRMFNHPFFRSILGNKMAQYLCLEEFMPSSFIASNARELKEAFSQLKSGKIVVKPPFGSGGFGILIDTPLEILKNKIKFPVLVQEFKESTKGIPGISSKPGLRDLRLIFSNHQLVYALSRHAKPASLLTNIHQGARAEKIPLDMIPGSALKIAGEIDRRMSFFPYSLYTLDFIFDDQARPWLMELNTNPGLDIVYLTGTKADRAKFFKDIIVKNLV